MNHRCTKQILSEHNYMLNGKLHSRGSNTPNCTSMFVQYLIAVSLVVLLELITGILGLVHRDKIVSAWSGQV